MRRSKSGPTLKPPEVIEFRERHAPEPGSETIEESVSGWRLAIRVVSAWLSIAIALGLLGIMLALLGRMAGLQ